MKYVIIGMVFGIILMIGMTILFIIYWYKSSAIKNRTRIIGSEAEYKINQMIKKWVKLNNASFIPANLFKYNSNKVFEVDGILITIGGIIVIEIKSISGNIIGDASEEFLTKEMKTKTFDIKNPIIQNDKHINHIEKILIEKVPIVSLIIFSNRAWDIKISNLPLHVVISKEVDLYRNLDEINSELEPAMNKNDIKKITKKLRSHCSKSFSTIKLHNKLINNQR